LVYFLQCRQVRLVQLSSEFDIADRVNGNQGAVNINKFLKSRRQLLPGFTFLDPPMTPEGRNAPPVLPTFQS